MIDRFAIRIARQGIVRSVLQIVDRPCVVTPPRKMHGQFSGDIACLHTIGRLHAETDLAVPPQSLAWGYALVKHIVVQGMAEAIAPSNGPVGPFHGALQLQKLPMTR